MRSIVKKLLTLTLAILLVFSYIGCNKNNTGNKELNQWDYFSEFISYSLYTVDENHKDYIKSQGWGQVVGSQSEYSIKRVSSALGGCNNYYYLCLTPIKEKSTQIEITRIEFDVYVERERNFRFKISFGSEELRVVRLDCYPNQANKISVEFYGEIFWETASVKSVFFSLIEPNWIGNNKYIFKNMVLTLKRR